MTRAELVIALNAIGPSTLEVVLLDPKTNAVWVVKSAVKTRKFKRQGQYLEVGAASEEIFDVVQLTVSEKI